jgi:AcrR family transcriptional regulator
MNTFDKLSERRQSKPSSFAFLDLLMNRESSPPPTRLVEHPMTRRALAKQQTRERLLDAARRLFTERGYEAATVRDIAAAADLSTGAVFASFSDKAELFNEVLIADYRALAERMVGIKVDGLPAREALLRLLDLAYQHHFDHLGLVQAALSFSWQHGVGLEARNRQGAQPILTLLAAVMSEGVEKGELAGGLDVKLATEMLWDSYLANYRRAIFDGWEAPALVARLASQLDIILAGYNAAA